jgi:fumarate hydratase class II
MTKTKKDFIGEVEIPDCRLYGACTQRTVNACLISDHKIPRRLIGAILIIKKACAIANNKLGKLNESAMCAILDSIKILQCGGFDCDFPLDIFQNGAGTSSNMNANEVISSIAWERFGVRVHPNDGVNMSQSTNDVIPSAINISCSLALKDCLLPSLNAMLAELSSHAEMWKDLLKIGRTHLQDAVPMTLGQEFSAYARQIEKCVERCHRGIEILRELPMGGTVIGTGLNAPHGFSDAAIDAINGETELSFISAKNKFCEQASRDSLVELSGIINSITAALSKIASDIKILSSGPRTGLGELLLPATQEGSSIMPGKVNPAPCEMLLQACHYANGMMLTALLGAKNGELQLNTAMPVTAYALLDSIEILSNGVNNFSKYCLAGLRPNAELSKSNSEKSLMLITAVTPIIGYERAASIVREAMESNESVVEVLKRANLLPPEEVHSLCDPKNMANPRRQDAPIP